MRVILMMRVSGVHNYLQLTTPQDGVKKYKKPKKTLVMILKQMTPKEIVRMVKPVMMGHLILGQNRNYKISVKVSASNTSLKKKYLFAHKIKFSHFDNLVYHKTSNKHIYPLNHIQYYKQYIHTHYLLMLHHTLAPPQTINETHH